MEIRAIRTQEIEEARTLLTQEPGWAARFQDPEEFRRLISKSQRALVAVDGGRILGFVRAITDDMSNGYLTLLIVRNGYRGKGVGRALVRAVMGEDPGMTWVLRADRGAQAFYERIGFVRSNVAMERPRARKYEPADLMKVDVYGRYKLELVRENGAWIAYRLDTGKRTKVPELGIPAHLEPHEIPVFLDDLYHEMSRPGQSIRVIADDESSDA